MRKDLWHTVDNIMEFGKIVITWLSHFLMLIKISLITSSMILKKEKKKRKKVIIMY